MFPPPLPPPLPPVVYGVQQAGERDPYEIFRRPSTLKQYLRQCEAYEGFHICPEVTKGLGDHCGTLNPVGKDSEEFVEEASRLAVAKYSASPDRPKGEDDDLELKRVVRATYQEQMLHLTFECKDGRFYEANVFHMSLKHPDRTKLVFLRPAKYYPMIPCCPRCPTCRRAS